MCCNISSVPQLMKMMCLNENQELGGISYLELGTSFQCSGVEEPNYL